MRVFIADDEIYVIELLKKLIDWEAMGFEIVGVANDGLDAVKMIEELKPEIVITDIRMPGIDGLDMIKKIKSNLPYTEFIVISGYKQFQYAQTAIQYGVKGYLVKPISEIDLTVLLKQILAESRSAIEHTDKIIEITKGISNAKDKMQSAFITCLSEKLELPAATIKDANEEYLCDFKEGYFLFIIFKIDYLRQRQSEGPMDLDFVLTQLIGEVNQFIAPLCHELILKQYEFKCLSLLNLENTEKIYQALTEVQNHMDMFLRKYGSLFCTTCLGSVQAFYDDIPNSYKEAVYSFEGRIMESHFNTLIFPLTKENTSQDIQKYFPSSAINHFVQSIEKLDLPGIRNQINQCFAIAENARIEYADYYWVISRKLYDIFLEAVQNLELFDSPHAERAGFLSKLENCTNIQELKALLIELISGPIGSYKNTEGSQEHTIVAVAKKYIAEHYMEKISLNDIATRIFLNPVYFSALFKRETGIPFTDYLNNYRIDVSKKLLKQLDSALSSVANTVGFTDVKYYSKVFKRIVGITPSQYKNKYLRHKSNLF